MSYDICIASRRAIPIAFLALAELLASFIASSNSGICRFPKSPSNFIVISSYKKTTPVPRALGASCHGPFAFPEAA